MRFYSTNDFTEQNSAWLVFRIDCLIKNQPVDVYMILALPSEMLLAHQLVEAEISSKQVDHLFKQGMTKGVNLPSRILLAKGDPAEDIFRQQSKMLGVNFESVPSPFLEALVAPLKQSFGQRFMSPSSMAYATPHDGDDLRELECAKKMIPDSYDPCSCASGKKYKFCCKRIFREIIEAMAAFEEGNLTEALQWIEKAKKVVGETAEVLCRESIVYSSVDPGKSLEILNRCLEVNPRHPRAHYLQGIEFKERGNYQGAIEAYQTAINNASRIDSLCSIFHNSFS